MKTQNFCTPGNYWIITNLVIIFLLIFTSCGIESTVRQFDNRMGETIRTMDNAIVFMDAWECPDDFSLYDGDKTEAWETRTIPLYNVATDDPDAIIVGFELAPSISDEYIDTDEEDDVRGYGSGAPAYEIVSTGDTDGHEAGTRTRAVIKFNPIKIKIQKCEYK